MHQHGAQNCGLDLLVHELGESAELRGISVSFHGGRIDYATAATGAGEKGAAELAEAVRGLDGGSVCRWDLGDSRCGKCGRLLEGNWGDGVQMRREGEKIVLERESCPTAPKLWLWRVLQGVKLEVRHLPSVVGAGEKWKVPLSLALVCGGAGLAGWLAEGWMEKLFFLVAYGAGAWKTAEEVWHQLQKRF